MVLCDFESKNAYHSLNDSPCVVYIFTSPLVRSMIFITGATGFLGRELLGRLLLVHPQETFCLLMRDSANGAPETRVRRLLNGLFDSADTTQYLSRICIVTGDVSERYFGMGREEFQRIASNITSVFHSAADTNLDQSFQNAERANIAGTQHVLEFALAAHAAHQNVRFHHISTAYVAGQTEEIVSPDDVVLSRPFRNAYEKSKAIAETQVKAHASELSAKIYRPSVIVGDSVTGETSAFNVLYIPVRFILQGFLEALPAIPHAPFDIVPVDYVADAISELSQIDCARGKGFHITAGVGRESSPFEIIDSGVHTFRRVMKKQFILPAFIAPELLFKAVSSFSLAAGGFLQIEKMVSKRIAIFSKVVPFLPYIISNPRFDTTATDKALQDSLGLPPLFKSYADTIFAYCFETNWGRKPWTNPENLPSWYGRRMGTITRL